MQTNTGVEPVASAPQPSPQPNGAAKRQPDYSVTGPAKDLMDECVNDASNNKARQDRDRQDWLNALFDRGGAENQYVIFNTATRMYETRGTDPAKGGLPAWMPRPVTNLFSNKLDGIVAIQNQSQPAQIWAPSTDDDEDQATAEVCENAVPTLLEEIDYDDLRPQINRAVALMDKVAVCLYYDNDPRHGTEAIVAQQCLTCAQDPEAEESYYLPMELPEEAPDTCPQCGGPLVDAEDPSRPGQLMGVDYPIGKMCASLHLSWEVSLPSSARSHRASKNPWILLHNRYAWQDALREFSQHRAALEAARKEGGWSKSATQRHFADAWRRLASPRAATDMAQGGSTKSDHDGPIVYRLYHDPINSDDFYFPDGLYAVMVNDVMIEAGPLPFAEVTKDGQRKPFKNVITRTYRSSPASQFGKPPADDLVPLQYHRNLLEGLLMAILMHNAAPRTFIPLSVTLEDPITGAPGQQIRYRSVIPGEVPTTAPGMNPPEGIYKWIEQIDAKADEVSKLNAVLQGERPAGDPTLGEIQILKEKGESAFQEPLAELTYFEKELARMLLHIARDTAWTKRLRQVQGDNGAWDITQWTQADLHGAVDVRVDPTTAWPKSPLMKKLALGEAMTNGVFQLLATDPELAGKLLELYDLADLKPSIDVDRRQIRRELDRWRAAHDPMEILPPDPVRHNLSMHLQAKTDFLKTEEFEALLLNNPPLAQAMLAHVAQIQALIQQQQMAAAAIAAGPQPPQEPPTDEGDGGATLDEAVQSGAITPADAGGTSLEQAMADGALVPADAAMAAQPAGPSIDDLVEQEAIFPAQQEEETPPAGLPGAY